MTHTPHFPLILFWTVEQVEKQIFSVNRFKNKWKKGGSPCKPPPLLTSFPEAKNFITSIFFSLGVIYTSVFLYLWCEVVEMKPHWHGEWSKINLLDSVPLSSMCVVALVLRQNTALSWPCTLIKITSFSIYFKHGNIYITNERDFCINLHIYRQKKYWWVSERMREKIKLCCVFFFKGGGISDRRRNVLFVFIAKRRGGSLGKAIYLFFLEPKQTECEHLQGFNALIQA